MRIDFFDVPIERRHFGAAEADAVPIPSGHLRAEHIKVVLNTSQPRDHFRHARRSDALFQAGARQPEKGRQLVDAADTFDARVVLAHAMAAQKPGLATVTAVEITLWHRYLPPASC